MSNNIGSLEELVLLAVGSLGSEAYAVAVQQQIDDVSGRGPTMGAVYTSLDRLEQKGFLRSSLGKVTHKAGGRRKRYYRLTDSGAASLVDARTARESLWARLELGPTGGGSSV